MQSGRAEAPPINPKKLVSSSVRIAASFLLELRNEVTRSNQTQATLSAMCSRPAPRQELKLTPSGECSATESGFMTVALRAYHTITP
jgi:hypothetical protein